MSFLNELQTVFSPEVMLWAGLGVLLGTLVGVLPGIGPTSAMAMLLAVTTQMTPLSGLVMLAGIYYGSQYGGSTTSILMNMPGEVSSVVTAFDGYPLARQGKAGHALTVAAISSFVAGTIGLVLLTLFAEPLSNLAFYVKVPDYFLLLLLAMTIIVSLAGRSLTKGILSAAVGLLFATVGLDPVTGTPRLTFGSDTLLNGFSFASASIGLFALGEVFFNAESSVRGTLVSAVGKLYPSLREILGVVPTMLRSTAIGFVGGLLPGVSPSTTSFIAYDVERRIAKDPSRFGKGALEGVAGPEGANNATTSSGFIPLMIFGIPPSPALAVLLGAFLIYGLAPGPLLFSQQPDIAWGLIGSMYAGNVMLLALNLPLVRMWVQVLKIPYRILAPVIILLSVVGALSLRNNYFDVWVTLLFGLIGYLMRKFDFPLAPMILAIVLGPRVEALLRRSLQISAGSWTVFVSDPVGIALCVLIVLSLVGGLWQRRRLRHDQFD
ncbi:MAG TPA: tripartite tricarboxylate transporter permease [Mycobacteriales bacterium]|nr:tripartite tricarboxylate transporter permease [Mycobacteriales bacterium]